MTLDERLWLRIDKGTKRQCWPWLGAVSGYGYGVIRVGSRVCLVHRVLYEHLHGPIPGKLTIDHLCRNKRCQNPAHWELVPRWENAHRKRKR